MSQPVLEARELAVSYGRISALSQSSLAVSEGGLLLLLGPNGAGKTSLVSALAGLIKPSAGTVTVQGQDVSRLPAFRRVRCGISLVPEGRGTLGGLSVRDNLFLGWHSAPRASRGSLSGAIDEIEEIFPRLGERRDQDCGTLSGGEMQMLAIARGLLARPKVLVLDEPSLGLAPQAVATVYRVLGELNRRGLAMIIVEQKAVPLDVVPETTMVLQGGQVIWSAKGQRPTEEELASLYLGGTTAS